MGTNKEIIEVIVKGAPKAKKQLGGVNSSLVSMAKKAGLAAGAYFGARGLLEGFKQLTLQGSKLQTVGQAFDNMGKKIDFTSGSLIKLQKATNGTVSNIDLMTKANNAMALSIVNSDDEMAELFDTAQRLGEALGVDTARALDSLVTGMGRQSKLMLDNLGIMVDANVAYDTYAVSVGKSANELDDLEKKTAFNNEAMRQARDIVNQMGPETETANRKMQELGATFSNMTADLGKALSPALENLTSKFVVAGMAVADFMREQTEDETQTAIRNLKEMGVDTRELELAYTSLQKNKALQTLGHQLTENVANTERITAANKEMESLEKQKLAHAQESLDLQERIMIATGGTMSLATASTANQIQANAMYGVQADRKRTDHLRELQEEKALFDEKQANFDSDIENLENEIEKRQDLMALRIQEQALSQEIDPEGVSEEIDPVVSSDPQIKEESKLAKFREKAEEARLKADEKLRASFKESDDFIKTSALKEAVRSSYGMASKAYQAMAHIPVIGPALGAAAAAAAFTLGMGYHSKISAAATGADYTTSGPELLLVGDNPTGKERVQVTPLGGDPNVNGPQGGMTINIQGSVIGTEQFTEDILMPQIEEGLRLGNRI